MTVFTDASQAGHTLAEQIRMACVMEATARKPGNVHPEARFDDLCHDDFVQSADAASEWLARANELGVGPAVLRAVEATRRRVSSNTNLGIALLIAPLAAVPANIALQEGMEDVLRRLTVNDSAAVFEAIRIAAPGGLGKVDEEDVREAPTLSLRKIMEMAAERDRIARQYAHGFEDVLEFGVSTLTRWRRSIDDDGETAVIGLHLSMMAEWPDTLIVRKCGPEVAEEARSRAAAVLAEDWPRSTNGQRALQDFDAWLRADGNRRNPGTTADMVAATLFAEIRETSRQSGGFR